MGYYFNVDKAMKEYGYKGQFPKYLHKVLLKIQTDPNITNVDEAAYLLATAKVESSYSLARWESDYLCYDKSGVVMTGRHYKGNLPKDMPCQKALDYYKSSDGKANYYSKPLDKRGLPYFGRGLIQLTWDYNYKKYGDIIKIDLINKPELALTPKNSYKIASAYLKNRTFKYVNNKDFAGARKSVKGKSKGWEEVKANYDKWKLILEKNKINSPIKATLVNYKKPILITSSIVVLGVAGVVIAGVIKKTKK